jgi:hypothetical protein
VHLTDAELMALDGRCSPTVQAAVNAATARVRAATTWPGLPHGLAGLVADTVTEARRTGAITYRATRLRSCDWCHREAGYATYQTGRRAGTVNRSRPLAFPGVEMSTRPLTVGLVHLGACRECMAAVTPVLVDALRDVIAETPTELSAPGRPMYRRHGIRHCTRCGWAGHDGQMRAVPGEAGPRSVGCPNCPAVNNGSPVIEPVDGFVVLDTGEVTR